MSGRQNLSRESSRRSWLRMPRRSPRLSVRELRSVSLKHHLPTNNRLPLFRARYEAAARQEGSVAEFVQHVLESWVLAQHAYWSVGRGLADARAGGKTLLRLRVVLDEEGWSLTRGADRGSAPSPTPDRLQTMISLMTECRLLGQPGSGALL